MVKLDKNGCSLYTKKVTFLDNGSEVVQYTDNPSEYESLVNKFKHLSNIVVEDVVATPEQAGRLEVVNALNLDLVEHWGAEIRDFVTYGYIDPETASILASIAVDYSAQSKEYVLSKLGEEVASYRYNKEVNGVEYDGMLAKTDRESQSTVASSMMAFLAGTLTSIDYKFKNGWRTFDSTTFPAFAKVVSDHVSNCFASENIVMGKLSAMSLEELLAKDAEGKQVINVGEMIETEYLSLVTAP